MTCHTSTVCQAHFAALGPEVYDKACDLTQR
jgi:hypothetical protein